MHPSRPEPPTSAPEIRFSRATTADAGEIMTVQRAAFVQEAQLYRDPEVPPLVESLDDIRRAITTATVIVGRMGHRLVAAGRVTVRDRVGHIGRLAVAPDLHGRGIGRALLAAVEASCAPEVDGWALFTGAMTQGNLHLYHSAGYVDSHTQHVRGDLTFVHMRKPMEVEDDR
jgi:GNAT superfamily N-acetyltransferase